MILMWIDPFGFIVREFFFEGITGAPLTGGIYRTEKNRKSSSRIWISKEIVWFVKESRRPVKRDPRQQAHKT